MQQALWRNFSRLSYILIFIISSKTNIYLLIKNKLFHLSEISFCHLVSSACFILEVLYHSYFYLFWKYKSKELQLVNCIEMSVK